MMPTDAVQRALKLTEKTLKDMGYEIVRYKFSAQQWEEARFIMFGLTANGSAVA